MSDSVSIALGRVVTDLGISARVVKILRRYGVLTVGDLVQLGQDDLMDMRRCGPRCLQEITEALGRAGYDPPSNR